MTDNSSIDISVTNIWHAWCAFRRGKKPSRSIVIFESDLENNLFLLTRDIHLGTYKHGLYTHKIINEKKRRDIRVAQVRDRVVHRLLYDYLVPIINSRLDGDVWSCRPGKGLHGALYRTKQLAMMYPDAYVWRGDIRKFFDHVDHTVLFGCLEHHTNDTTTLKLCKQVIRSYTSRQTDRQTDRQTLWHADW